MTKYIDDLPDSLLTKNLAFVRKRLKEEVKRQGYTYEAFALLFKKTEAWFSHMVNGYRKITIDTLLEIAEKLNINPASLLPGDNPVELPTFEDYIKSIIDDHTKDEAKKIIKEEIENYFKRKKGGKNG